MPAARSGRSAPLPLLDSPGATCGPDRGRPWNCFKNRQTTSTEEFMGVFDKMFGSGASGAAQQPNADERFAALKLKYESVLRALEEHQVRLHNLHVENGKLFIRGIAPSDDAKNKVWDQIKRVNPNYDD